VSTLDLHLERPLAQKDDFSTAITISLVVHIALVTILTLKTVFFQREAMIYENAVRVDLVALPDKVTQGATQAAPTPPLPDPAKPVPAKPVPAKVEPVKKMAPPKIDSEAINLEKSKHKQEASLKKLKALSSMDKIRKQVAAEERLKKSQQLFKGNELSSGTELTGLSAIQHDNYVMSVKQQIYQSWSLPEWLSKKNLKAQIVAKYDESGKLISKHIVRSSGNPTYDDLILEAVERSSPVPPPPEKLAKIIKYEGILIGFPE
jgi:colicin import membrane protein